VTAGLKAPSDTADSGLDQDPEVDVTFAGAGQPAGGGTNGARGARHRKVVRLDRRRKPLEREPWTRQRDETSAQGTRRSKPSRACETLRAERSRARDARCVWTPRAEVVKREETPRKALEATRADDCLMEL